MNFKSIATWFITLCLALLFVGCASTPKVDWTGRVGQYTYDQAVLEMGPPDRAAELSDGTRVVQWVLRKGGNRSTASWLPGSWIYTDDTRPLPDELLTLTFTPDGVLKDSKRSSR